MVSLKPSDFVSGAQTITDFIGNGTKPSPKTASEIHSLDIHCVRGISSVKEALTTWSSEHGVGYQELSRYVCLVLETRMSQSPEVLSVAGQWSDYWKAAKGQKQAVRRASSKPLEGLSKGYFPLTEDSYHIWCWDDNNKKALFGTLKKINMGVRLLNPFAAGVLSELPDLGELAEDLEAEYQQGLRHLRLMAICLTYFIAEFTRKNGIW